MNIARSLLPVATVLQGGVNRNLQGSIVDARISQHILVAISTVDYGTTVKGRKTCYQTVKRDTLSYQRVRLVPPALAPMLFADRAALLFSFKNKGHETRDSLQTSVCCSLFAINSKETLYGSPKRIAALVHPSQWCFFVCRWPANCPVPTIVAAQPELPDTALPEPPGPKCHCSASSFESYGRQPFHRYDGRISSSVTLL